MNKNNIKVKKGYLKEDFRVFHLKDKKNINYEFHYHDFYKIIYFISGKVKYLIEGKEYNLTPGDVLLISSEEIHRPIIDFTVAYERVVIWVNPLFLKKHRSDSFDLSGCFNKANERGSNLLSFNNSKTKLLADTLKALENELSGSQIGSHILSNSLLIQFMVYTNRICAQLKIEKTAALGNGKKNNLVNNIIKYINQNLDSQLTIEKISSHFYISRYYLMHKFKEQTGYTVYNYILQKRLLRAKSLLEKGMSVVEVCGESGFNNYSSFIREFKKNFGLPPKKYYNEIIQSHIEYEKKGHF